MRRLHSKLSTPARGVTLIELMTSLAVLAVLAILALPSFSGTQQRHRLVAAAEALAGDLAEARFEAARSGQTLYVQSQGGAANNWCWSVASQSGCPCATSATSAEKAPGCRLKAVRAADHPGIQLLQPLQARLDAQGSAGTSVQTELSSAHGQRLRVELTALGRSRICVPEPVAGSPIGRYPSC
jgi:type IV fimbrial biogenesis protein FimT